MRGTSIRDIWRAIRGFARDQRGNTMFLTAAAVVPIIGIVGSGVDIGRAYMAELRLQQACDAGVLAGRRAMTGTTYTTDAQAEANKMFSFNYPSTKYGSSGVTFSSAAQGASTVAGTATATLPTALMQIFGFDVFNLSVACSAKLEISNVDVMMVLDVTGSMTTVNPGDSANRMVGLKAATMSFFDTLTAADTGDGRLRFGVVPYSSAANVGAILNAKNPAWLRDSVLLPSRTPIYRVTWGNAETETGPSTDGTTTYGSWTNVNTISGKNATTCPQTVPPADTSPSASGSPTTNQTGQYVDGDGNRITTYNNSQTYTYYNYRYYWDTSGSTNRCRQQRRVATFTRTSTTTVTETPIQTFDNKYRYEDRTFDVSAVKNGTTSIVTDTGDSGANVSYSWGGCVIERDTEPFGPTETAPSDALDMDVDSVPTSEDATKWQVLIPEIAFARASHPSYTPSSTGAIEVSSSSVTSDSSTNGSWQRYSKYWSNGWGVCPAAAMKLTTMTSADRATFNTYVNSLQPVGGTYHDSGMVWGVRLLSPNGLFADENATAPNGRPISRHIVFMTDGDMAPNMGNLTFQGYEPLMQRVGGTTDAALRDRHNNRFLQLCEKAKAKNITVWVVSFGLSLNTQMTTCATAGNAFAAANSAQLNQNFQAIARQISKLRLSQ